ncbi:hypothetical protein JW949_00910 [Candidatus Woesearchaeota archaeon]|nr:hypothetical protein [Candidatus Woesearchaeota archaeon]
MINTGDLSPEAQRLAESLKNTGFACSDSLARQKALEILGTGEKVMNDFKRMEGGWKKEKRTLEMDQNMEAAARETVRKEFEEDINNSQEPHSIEIHTENKEMGDAPDENEDLQNDEVVEKTEPEEEQNAEENNLTADNIEEPPSMEEAVEEKMIEKKENELISGQKENEDFSPEVHSSLHLAEEAEGKTLGDIMPEEKPELQENEETESSAAEEGSNVAEDENSAEDSGSDENSDEEEKDEEISEPDDGADEENNNAETEEPHPEQAEVEEVNMAQEENDEPDESQEEKAEETRGSAEDNNTNEEDSSEEDSKNNMEMSQQPARQPQANPYMKRKEDMAESKIDLSEIFRF